MRTQKNKKNKKKQDKTKKPKCHILLPNHAIKVTLSSEILLVAFLFFFGESFSWHSILFENEFQVHHEMTNS